jgi:hypothetical protein
MKWGIHTSSKVRLIILNLTSVSCLPTSHNFVGEFYSFIWFVTLVGWAGRGQEGSLVLLPSFFGMYQNQSELDYISLENILSQINRIN